MVERKFRTVNVNLSTMEIMNLVKAKLEKEIGLEMSYSQVIQFLCNEWVKRNK